MKEKLDDSFYIKVRRIAEKKKYFTAKELFQDNQKTPEHLLRQALSEMRENNEIYKHRSHKNTVYSFSAEAPQQIASNAVKVIGDAISAQVLEFLTAKKDEWKSATAIIMGLNPPPRRNDVTTALEFLKTNDLVEFKQDTHDLYRAKILERQEEPVDQEILARVRNMIEKNGFGITPDLMEKLDLSRANVTMMLDTLIQQKLVYKVGEKKGTKYLWHNKNVDDVEKLIEIKKSRCEIVDRLHEILRAQGRRVSLGIYSDGSQFKVYDNGRATRVEKFAEVDQCIKFVHNLTNKIDGASNA